MRIELTIKLESGKGSELTRADLKRWLEEKQEELNNMGFNAHTISYTKL